MMKNLPKTHALIRLGLKVSSITKSEVFIKNLIKEEEMGDNNIEKWTFPDF